MKKSLKKTAVLTVLLSMLMCIFSGCEKTDAIVIPVVVQGSIFSGNSNDNVSLDLEFDPDWITVSNNKKYNSRLAAFAALLSEDVYYRQKDLDKGTQNRVLINGTSDDQYDQTMLLKSLGFDDVRYIESYKLNEYEYDTNDSVTMVLGYLEYDKYDAFVVSVRGCFSAGEWYSIFDPGADTENYEKYTGSHPEWTDRDMLKGVNIASNRAKEFINEYIAEHDDPERKNTILITGHSRGGIIAEAVGASFEDNKSFKSYTYTFNSDPVTENPDAQKYRTIFNIYDSGDFFTDVMPFGNQKLYRYGKTLCLAVVGEPDVKNAVADLKGRDDYCVLSGEAADDYYRLFKNTFPTRESLYDPYSEELIFDSEDEANERHSELKNIISAENGLGIEEFVSISEVVKNEQGSYSFNILYCRGAFLICSGKILAYGTSAYDAVKDLFSFSAEMCSLADYLIDNYLFISGGHLLINSYVLTKYVK